MKQHADPQLLQQPVELETLKQVLRQEREQAALAREETESFRQQLQKLKGYVKDSQNEAKEAKQKAFQLQQCLAERERSCDSQSVESSSQLSQYQRRVAAAETENANYRARLEKLAVLLREKEKKIVELQQYEISFRKVSEQKSLHDSVIEKHLERNRLLEKELENSSQQLLAARQQIEDLETLVEEFRQKQENSHHEMQALQSQFNSLKKNLDDSKKDIAEAESRQKELESFLQVEETTSLDELRMKFDSIKEELRTAQQVAADRQILKAEKDALQMALGESKSAQEDAEGRLKIAHQHLAKKVKETALLNDNAQLHEEQLHDLQEQLNLSRIRIAEMQQALDGHALQESRLQEQIQQSSRSMEALTSRWEEKYFKIYEKWQEGEVRIKEMKKLEERCSQMQSLLAGISSVFGMPVSPSAPAPLMAMQNPVVGAAMTKPLDMNSAQPAPIPMSPIYEEERTQPAFYGQLAQPHLHSDEDDMTFTALPLENLKSGESDKSVKGPYQSLFDMPQQTKRPKNTFFD